jgi:glutathione peroxidase
MKNLLLIIASLFVSTFLMAQTNLHSFTVNDINGDAFDMSQLKGKKVMIVNTASKCGFTPQYAELQELYEKYQDKNFIIIGFPANNFMNQEPRTNEEIKEFCSLNYGVTFPMMEKISIKGADIAPIYRWLTHKVENGVEDAKVGWNFHKFLIDEDGNWVSSISTKTSPLDDAIINWIEGK